MKKRIASIALSLAMCLILLPTAAYAEDVSEGGAFDSQSSTGNGAATVTGSNEAVDTTKNTAVPTNEDVENLSDEDETKGATENGEKTWGDFADTSWYVGHETTAEYHITTAEQLAGLAQLVNADTSPVTFKDKTIYLDKDIDLSEYQWTPIGKGSNFKHYFDGTFDGQYHKIMNLYHHYTGEDLTRNGLFGVISSGGTVKNLMVVDADIVSNDCSLLAGILADWVNGGTVENCYTSGKIENNVGDKMVGGLIGQCTWRTQVKGCGSDAIVVSTETSDEHVDTVGGLIGQWENSDPDSLIADCWFGGSVSCQNENSGVGGILGANFDFRKEPGVKIKNCMVATKNITCAEPGNITWITAAVKVGAENCIWPNSAPADVSLDEWYNGNYLAAVKLKIEGNNAYMDPDFDQSVCGNAVSDFKSADVLTGLQTHQGTGIEWVAGIKHPTFAWDKRNISADYTKVDEAIAAAEAIDGSRYTNYDAVEAAINAVDRNKSVLEQADVDQMAKNIRDAIAALVEKSNNSSSSSGGGGSSTPRYAVTVPDKTENGSLSVTPKNAKKGSDVTITATPDKGCEVGDIVAKDANGNKLTLKDNGDGTYTFTMPASKVTVTAAFAEKKAEPIVPEKLFADVSAEEYYYEAVKWASENGVTGGIGENLFGAKLPCTRAQIVTFLWRAAGSPEPKGMSGFVDVSADAYYAKAVAWAVEQGIVSGTSATTFSPDAVCTRAQSVAFLYRAFGTRTDKAAGFSDVSADAYYADAVAWAVENGVASGIGGGLFAPDQDCARGQIVAFLYRAYQNK